ncbi:hypothetical protein [Pseudoalteromonas luteoviolacea]|uniref:Phosphoribulokinase/uridine kinase domain-containing protein n=1 Tax=Pseudoalteromonas luteoviolacea NCIMB 1942 TaxID=1365253 RepID=A0A162AD14_9GAMM|nr:hypothetical protein [Pseudoalteromonas luteoviolacea]KZN46078.1 hypothetical protein N482_02235 [Pseudoalteromonas luteoviolacea NCIMB 1942]
MTCLAPWQAQFCKIFQLPFSYVTQVEKALGWLEKTVERSETPLIVAISGCQGSGKSTLSAYMVAYLQKSGVLAESVSIDDFYLSQSQRKVLVSNYHPAFETRGAPGTHDVKAAIQALHNFKRNKPFVLPRFDKSTDNPFPESVWTTVSSPIDVLIIEGWFLGIPAQPETLLVDACNQFEVHQDATSEYRKQVNEFLALDYQCLFGLFDKLLFLNGKSFEHVYNWRLEQEQKLVMKTGKGMDQQQVQEFIQSYQRLTQWGIEQLPKLCDLELVLDATRNVTAVFDANEKGAF